MNLYLLTFVTLTAARQYLSPNRVPKWKTDNPNYGPDFGQPEQIHVSLGESPTEMVVTWLTFDDPGKTLVNYGPATEKKPSQVIEGKCTEFVDKQRKTKRRYIHRATLTGLTPGTTYNYRVGSEYGWSALYRFTALSPREDGGYEIAVFGDLGNQNARSLGKLQRLAQDGDIDMVFHVGDFAYNMDTDNGRVGDEFMRQLEPIAAYVPYMTAVGNHEAAANFSHYANRFTMPRTDDNMLYSFDLGSAHFIFFSTEFYFSTEYGWKQIQNQWNWLMNDLTEANANRESVPWIFTFGHRPMYCSDFDGDDCTKYESIIRTGLPKTHAYGLEKLFYQFGVDVEIWAHEHSYERMWPVFNRTVYNGTVSPYTNPLAPVHIVSGSAGCRENTDMFVSDPGPWSARRSSDYGFGILRVHNATHVHFRQVAAYKDETQDDFWIIKHPHHSYKHEHRRYLSF
ncbi:hypothetical protein Y032_0307g2022 [Ancylostoma ceylanicum]|uniref:Purple acid phosphatase n=1 Tax=Ancylostoma ceylanicum TaxID=53326 RepID=A0A016S3U6_9BILA|nr:hypothetical protein Y032_0307g2022 [Ancylostoma ceylanicum]